MRACRSSGGGHQRAFFAAGFFDARFFGARFVAGFFDTRFDTRFGIAASFVTISGGTKMTLKTSPSRAPRASFFRALSAASPVA